MRENAYKEMMGRASLTAEPFQKGNRGGGGCLGGEREFPFFGREKKEARNRIGK